MCIRDRGYVVRPSHVEVRAGTFLRGRRAFKRFARKPGLQRARTVSYTHLDVYKRQSVLGEVMASFLMLLGRKATNEQLRRCGLYFSQESAQDVYKRQGSRRGSAGESATSARPSASWPARS